MHHPLSLVNYSSSPLIGHHTSALEPLQSIFTHTVTVWKYILDHLISLLKILPWFSQLRKSKSLCTYNALKPPVWSDNPVMRLTSSLISCLTEFLTKLPHLLFPKTSRMLPPPGLFLHEILFLQTSKCLIMPYFFIFFRCLLRCALTSVFYVASPQSRWEKGIKL